MAPEPVKCTLKKFGTFSTPTFGGVGEPFHDGRQAETRTAGRQFSTNKQRAGQTGDNWNSGTAGRRIPIQRLYEGEKYIDPHKHQVLFDVDERKKNLTTNGFKYSSPNKHSSGLGGVYGMIGPKYAHQADFNVLKKEDKPGPVVHELRQVINNNPKAGYGPTPGIVFGPGPAKGEASSMGRYGGKEYLHATDPYDLPRQQEIAERKHNAVLIGERAAFKGMSSANDFFDQKHRTVASSKVFTEEPRIKERDPPAPQGKPVTDRPFYPSRAPRSGPQGTFEKFPVYKEDPLEEKIKAAKAAAAAARVVGAAPFKPTSNPHTTPTPTISFHIAGPKPKS